MSSRSMEEIEDQKDDRQSNIKRSPCPNLPSWKDSSISRIGSLSPEPKIRSPVRLISRGLAPKFISGLGKGMIKVKELRSGDEGSEEQGRGKPKGEECLNIRSIPNPSPIPNRTIT